MGGKRIHIIDTTLRDGSHAIRHQITEEMAFDIARRLSDSGAEYIEVSHGDGLNGSSYNYGFSLTDEYKLIAQAVKASCGKTRIAALLIPGIGTIRDMERAVSCGVSMVRVATHVTEADVAIQHIRAAKSMGIGCCGFLMMVHRAAPQTVLHQAQIMEEAGADYINLADSAGNLLPHEVKERVALLSRHLHIPVGFHAHNNLGMAIANSLCAIESGAVYIDSTLRGLGAGAGNAQHELLACLLKRERYDICENEELLMEAASCLDTYIKSFPKIDNNAIMLGNEGVYSSFMLHVERISSQFSVSPYQLIKELGRRKAVGGQEDMITEIAYLISNRKAF